LAARRSKLVWSSDGGRTCPECGLPEAECSCDGAAGMSAGDGTVRVGRESKGRRGKAVRGLPNDPALLDDLARELKRHCGTGGTVKNGVVEIQGDQRDRVVAALGARGYRVKRAGG